MNSRERIARALQHKEVDRIPVVNIFNLNYLKKMLNLKGNIIEQFVENPIDTIVKFQEDVGHDPIINIYTQQEPEQIRWPNTVFKWRDSDSSGWVVKEEIINYSEGSPTIKRIINTPRGSLQSVYRRESCQNWVMEYPLKKEEDIELLKFRPDPEKMDTSVFETFLKKLDNRAFVLIGIPSVWQEACSLRGLENILYDLYDRPEWVRELLDILMDYSVRLARKLSQTDIDCIMVNESYVGLGMSLETYEEFIWPRDKKIIEEANKGGVLTSLHICGKCNALLEKMAESGATCIEPLVPPEYSGDVELADAKKRVGDKVGLWGGFRERVLTGSSEDVEQEVKRCLDAAARCGGYVLRGTGQIYDAKIENLRLLKEAVLKYLY